MPTRLKRAVLLVLAVLFLAGSGMFVAPMQRERVRYDLTSDPVKGVSPQLMLATTALGAFRGIIVDLVWIRLQRLMQEGRHFEIVQLGDWACKLAPRFPQIWQFHAWNMAYNVSVEIPYLPERWSWVYSGIRLLRDEAIPANPNEPKLYWGVGWIFQQKVGEQLDDAHMIYKQQLGLLMHEVLGGDGARDDLEKFAAAPHTADELLQDEEVKKLYEACLQKEFDLLDEKRFFAWFRRPDSAPAEVDKLLRSPGNKAAFEKVENFMRARRLRQEWKLEPEKMIEIVDEYGPFDWRSPYPHAIYWATLGHEKATALLEQIERKREEFGVKPEDLSLDPRKRVEAIYRDIDYDRLVYGALQSMVRHGRLVYDSEGRLLPVFAPDYRFTEPMIRLYEAMLEKYGETIHTRGVHAAYANFLRRVIVESYFAGEEKAAIRYWQLLRKKFPDVTFPIENVPVPISKVPFTQYMDVEIEQYLKDMGVDDARKLVRQFLTRAYVMLAFNAIDQYDAFEGRASVLSRRWNADAETARWRIPYEQIRESVLMDFFSGRIRLGDELMDNLRRWLEQQGVDWKKYAEAAQKEQEKTAKPKEIEEELKWYKPAE